MSTLTRHLVHPNTPRPSDVIFATKIHGLINPEKQVISVTHHQWRMIRFLTCTIMLMLPAAAMEELRTWRSNDGQLTLEGTFVNRDEGNITLRRPNGNPITFALSRLHPEDVRWLDNHHPYIPPGPPPNAVFDHLVFGDTRQDVTTKLLRSELVELTFDEHLLARLGLNGAFRTRATIGGLPVSLFFDWDDQSAMREVSLQTTPHPADQVTENLVPCIDALKDTLVAIHGPPKKSTSLPALGALAEGMFIGSHLWEIEQGTILLGLARDREGFMAVARIGAK